MHHQSSGSTLTQSTAPSQSSGRPTGSRFCRAAALMALVSLGLLLGVLRLTAPAYAEDAESAQAGACATVSAIPTVECEALVALYQSTGGPQWDDNSGWLDPAHSPCTWYGVGCAGGHVTELLLESNHLSGTLPAALMSFDFLARLRLADNLLRGEVPPAICGLVDSVTDAGFDYNQLRAGSGRARTCITHLDPNWADSQTRPPADLRVSAIATGSLTLTWTPIRYTGDGGYYEIGYSLTPNGPIIPHGVTVDKTAGAYVLDGLAPGIPHFVRVRTVTPAHANQENDQVSAAATTVATTLAADGSKVLLLLYFPADNDLSPYVPGVVERVRRGSTLNPNVQVLMLADRAGDHNTGLLEIANGTVVTSTALLTTWGKDELDTTDPAVLTWFLTYGRNTFPAARTMVSLMGHGMGLMPEFQWLVSPGPGQDPVPQPGLPALPRGIEATPGDLNDNGGYLSTLDFGRALAAATGNGAEPFDLLFFDQCFQGSLDVLYELRNAAQVFIASPNYAWLSAPYHQYVTALAPGASAEQIAQVIIRLYEGSLTDTHPNAIFWVRGADIEPIADAASALADALRGARAGGHGPAILAAAREAQYVDTTQCGRQNLQLGPPDELLGAGSFAGGLRDRFPAGDAFGVNSAAEALLLELEKVTGLARTGSPYLDPTVTWDYQDSLTLLAPLRPDAPGSVAWRASIYRADMPLTAVWSPAPTQTVQLSDTFAYVQEGAWDEFIADWYTTPLTPTIGEWCQYIPPVLVTGEVTETLALDAQPVGGNLELSFTETTFDDAAGYWLLVRRPHDVNWVVLATLPLDQTSYTTAPPAPGETHRYSVVAQDALGVTLAQSNEVQVTGPGGALYLPLVPGSSASSGSP